MKIVLLSLPYFIDTHIPIGKLNSKKFFCLRYVMIRKNTILIIAVFFLFFKSIYSFDFLPALPQDPNNMLAEAIQHYLNSAETTTQEFEALCNRRRAIAREDDQTFIELEQLVTQPETRFSKARIKTIEAIQRHFEAIIRETDPTYEYIKTHFLEELEQAREVLPESKKPSIASLRLRIQTALVIGNILIDL